MEKIVSRISLDDFEAALVICESLEEAFSLEAEPANLFALFLALRQGFQVEEKFGILVLKNF